MLREYVKFAPQNTNNNNLYQLFAQLMAMNNNNAPMFGNQPSTPNPLTNGLLSFGSKLFDKAKARQNDGIYQGQNVNDYDPAIGKPEFSIGANAMNDRQKAAMYGINGNAPVGAPSFADFNANSVQDAFNNNIDKNNIIGGW